MTVTGGGAGDEPTRIDRDPPSFPSVGESQPSGSTPSPGAAPLFSSAATPSTVDDGAQTPPLVTTPGAPQSAGSGGIGGRLRWLIAGAATLLVVLVVGGVLFLAAPRAGAPSLLSHYAPADTGMYMEVRLDLPGDQRDNLAAFMSHFPGFADQASFQQKLDETLNSVLAKSSTGLDWNADVKPWFGGQISIFGSFSAFGSASGPQMMLNGATMSSSMMNSSTSVIALVVTDKSKLGAVIDAHIGGAQVASTDYQGQQIKTIAQPSGTSVSVAYVMTDDALLVAPSIDLIKQALDVKAGQKPALADDAYFTQQLGALHADRLATLYYNAGQQLSAMPMPSGLMPAQCAQIYQSLGQVKYVGELRAETDHLAFSLRAQVPSGDNAPPLPHNGQTTLAQTMPADTLFYLEARNVGDTAGWLIKNLLTCMTAAQPAGSPGPSAPGGLGDPAQLFETFMGTKPGDYLDFVGDVAVGLSYTSDNVNGGLVATVDDQAVATQRVDKLLSFIKLMGSGLGGQSSGTLITTEDQDHNGIKVTVIHIAGTYSRAAPITIQVAVANGRLYLGMDDFVTAALDRSATNSLASNARYQKAISASPGDNAGIVYVDIADAVAAMEAGMPADQKQQFETNSKPFIDPLSSFSIVNHVDGGTIVSNGFLFVE